MKANLPELSTAVEARFSHQPPTVTFRHGEDLVEAWDAADFDPWETLDWPAVRVLRYRQHKPNGSTIQADWLTDFSLAKLGARSLYKLAKSRWEIENQGFNDGKNRYGMEHICHHEPNSLLVNWLIIALTLTLERLYRCRHLHRGTHRILEPVELFRLLLLSLARSQDSS